MKCKHKWVDMEDGSLDRICVKCRKFAMQASLSMSASAEMTAPIAMNAARETMEVPYLTPNGDHARVEVYKDDLIKRMHKEIGLSVNLFENAAR